MNEFALLSTGIDMGNENLGHALLVLVGIVCLVPIFLMMRAWAEGEVDAAVAISVSGGTLGLFILAYYTAIPTVVFVCAALMLLLSIGVPLYYWQQGKALHQQLDDDDIAKYHAALQRDSRNSGAHVLLAEAYLKKQRYTEAVAHLEAAITISPDPEINPRVSKWTRRLEEARREKAEWEAKATARNRPRIGL